jgi:hypothetical protein
MSGNIIFQSLQGGGGVQWDKWPTEVVEITTLYEFEENDIFCITVPLVTHIWITFSNCFTHFTIKMAQRMAFKKNT